jgi:plasmid maintenance system killer protein
MEVRFADHKLGLIETARAAETGLPFGVIAAARSRLNIVRAAPDESTLLKWKSLRYERIEGSNGINGWVALIDAWKLDLSLSTSQVPNVVTVVNATSSR